MNPEECLRSLSAEALLWAHPDRPLFPESLRLALERIGLGDATFLPGGTAGGAPLARYKSALGVWLGDAVSLSSRAGVSRGCVRPRCA